jgi:HPr kinase/phosphorylase
MPKPVTTLTLFELHKDSLSLSWVAGESGAHRHIKGDEAPGSRTSLAGHLNAIHPNQVQILGRWEEQYLKGLGKNSYHDVIEQLFKHKPAAIIVADGLRPDDTIITLSEERNVALMTSPISSQKVVKRLQYYLDRELAETSILHGVFMEVHGLGVLLCGKSGIGKSELALELINRGHRLIADDAPEFSRSAPDTVRGSCPTLLRGFLEVRGLGILNIREMFGDSAITPSKNLRLIVNLKSYDDQEVNELNRLEGSYDTRTILDVEIQEVVIPVAPGRNLAVLVEAATRQYIQLQSGYNASLDFIRKQQQFLLDNTKK